MALKQTTKTMLQKAKHTRSWLGRGHKDRKLVADSLRSFRKEGSGGRKHAKRIYSYPT